MKPSGEPLPTDGTVKVLLSGVAPHVSAQMILLAKPLTALGAAVRVLDCREVCVPTLCL